MTRLTAGDVVVADERSTYDSQNRLRSTTYLDGSPLKPRKPRTALRGLDSHFQNWG